MKREGRGRDRCRGEGGSVAIVAAVLALLALTLGLVLCDVMVVLRARGEAQTAADAAAKAAGLELSPLFGVGSDPAGAAARYAALNGAEMAGCVVAPEAGRLAVTVTVRRRAATLFTPLGRNGFCVTATARCYFDPQAAVTAGGADAH